MLRIALLLSILASIPACDRSKINESTWKETGAQAVLPFKQGLKRALLKGIESGPVQAISACRIEAPRIADSLSTGNLKMGRTSQKLRNPNNAPKPWMAPFLEAYANDPDSREPKVVLIDQDTVGYVEPIFVQPLCLTCHGTELAPELAAAIEQAYPSDQATGYVAGDLRGIFWAELPRE
jgi:hypothetical protein